jgi:hypothetical protein
MITFGKAPFLAKNLKDLKNLVLNSEPEFPEDADPNLCDFIKICLEKDSRKRASLE